MSNRKTTPANHHPSAAELKTFRSQLYLHFTKNGRVLPWRGVNRTPYHIFISEVMLQQTQVARVTVKFREFIAAFPTFAAIHTAPLQHVLTVWQGLGYNRRALMVKKAAAIICEDYNGTLPDDPAKLIKLPGIGRATAASIAAFAFNKPTLFIETNIRAVFIHHFFNNLPGVDDSEILPLVEQTIDKRNPYRFYSALMDYGTHLKQTQPNPSRQSSAYVRQSRFEGSNRQKRGMVVREMLAAGTITIAALSKKTTLTPSALDPILASLVRDGLIRRIKNRITI